MTSEEPSVNENGDNPVQPQLSTETIEAGIADILRTVYDPEIPVDIYELGLICGCTKTYARCCVRL